MRLTVSVLVAALTGACASESLFGVAFPGGTSEVRWHSVESAGGQAYESHIFIDSATGRYAISRCQGPVTGTCDRYEDRMGDVPPAVLQQLFDLAQASDFVRLKAEYRLPGDVVPPDGGWTTLTIVVGERRKTVSWSKHVSPPEILREFGCLLLAATESLLCD